MAGDGLGAERDLDPVDIALHHDLLVGVRRRRRVVHQPVAYQGRGRDLARHMLAGLEGRSRQIAQGLEIGQQRRRLPPASSASSRSRQRASSRPVFSDIALEGSATLQMTGWAERRSGVARL